MRVQTVVSGKRTHCVKSGSASTSIINLINLRRPANHTNTHIISYAWMTGLSTIEWI